MFFDGACQKPDGYVVLSSLRSCFTGNWVEIEVAEYGIPKYGIS